VKKIILSILVLSLAACGSLQASATPTPFLQPTPVPFKPTEQFNAQPPATSTASPFPTPDTGLTGLPVKSHP